jgi:hypothetical protein
MTILEKYQEYPRTCELTVAEDIVFSIVEEMNGRKGLDGFEDVDEDIQEEIIERLVDIVNKKLKK